MRLTIAIVYITIFTSCGPAVKLRRAERIIKKAELQGATWTVDTVYRDIPVIVPEIKFDTLIRELNFKDTLVITRNKVVTKIKVDTINKTIYVSTKCPERSTIQKTPVIVNKTIQAKTWLRWWYILVAFAVGYIMGRLANLR